MNIHACTIVARNYLAAARVLTRSFLAVHSDARFTVLVVDDERASLNDSEEPFEVMRLSALAIDPAEILRMAAIYDVTEFCTAVKPWLLERLASTADLAIYLDPDIKVYAPFNEVLQAAGERPIILTPHVTRPMPRDGLNKSESQILESGIYNLGFIALAGAPTEFFSFWKTRLSRDCVADPGHMRFVDQRWVDFVPGMFPVSILRDTTYNVAYWNLDHRELRGSHGHYTVDGRPLHFFHFSGYDPRAPHLLSKHQGQHPRVLLSERPEVAAICEEYRSELLECGYERDGQTPYGFARAGELILDRQMRRLYRRALLTAETEAAAPPPNPFADYSAFSCWLNEPDTLYPGLTRYLAAVYTSRPDVQRVYRDPDGEDALGFATWIQAEVASGRLSPELAAITGPTGVTRARLSASAVFSRLEHKLSDVPLLGTSSPRVRLNLGAASRSLQRGFEKARVPRRARPLQANMLKTLEAVERRLTAVPIPGTEHEAIRLNVSRYLRRMAQLTRPASVREAPPPRQDGALSRPGIRVAGYLRTESGVGQLGRLMLAAASCASIPTSAYVDTTTVSRQQHPLAPSDAADLNVNLICVNADELPNFAKRAGTEFFDHHYSIGYWAWETESFPPRFAPAFDYVDEVWALSTFARDAIAELSPKPVFACPLPVVEPEVHPIERASMGIAPGFMFLFCFDLLSIIERKNPFGLIEAFVRAFEDGEGPQLVIKAINGNYDVAGLERLRLAAAGRSDITVLDQYLDSTHNAGLIAASDCYISLHRAEGFGLTLAEAMALGKPVIATGYSGNMDFMTDETAFLVPWSYTSVPPGCPPYIPGTRWAEPDLAAASSIMREVAGNEQAAFAVGQRARDHVLKNHSPAARIEFIRARFAEAQQRLNLSTIPMRQQLEPRTIDELVASRPPLDAPSAHPRTARIYRKFLARALQSHDDHQRQINKALVDAVGHLNEARGAIDRLASGHQETAEVIQELDAEFRALAGRYENTAAIADQLHAIPYMADPSLLSTVDSFGRPAIGYRDVSPFGADYASFEDVFRGSEELIRQRMRPYIELVAHHEPVVDLGAGRGEFLSLLSEQGVMAWGVDSDPSMVARARQAGLTAYQEDAVAYLTRQADASLGAIFCAQVVEHLELAQLTALIKESRRVLRDDGLLIMETVNPHAVHAFKAFWTDLSHRVPIFPEVLALYCAEAGFVEAIVTFPQGSGDLEADRWTAGEYAVVARVATNGDTVNTLPA